MGRSLTRKHVARPTLSLPRAEDGSVYLEEGRFSSPAILRSCVLLRAKRALARSALQLDVVPKPDPVSHMCIGGPRRLVCPSRAFAAMASIDQIEKLHTVGTAMIGRRLGGRLEKFHAYRRRRKVMIAVELDRLIAFCYDLTMPRRFHKLSLFVVSSDLGRSDHRSATRRQCVRSTRSKSFVTGCFRSDTA